jgi:sterol desaturase/sphingolipid hydroxylase (fatty acid hydroxylase superfamily)
VNGTVGWGTEYAGFVETVLSNQLPSVGPLFARGVHPLVHVAWLILRLSQTYETHSGFALDGSLYGWLGLAARGAAFHDHHHTTNAGNFGNEHWDWVFGTMDHWVRDGCEAGYLARRLPQPAAKEGE